MAEEFLATANEFEREIAAFRKAVDRRARGKPDDFIPDDDFGRTK